MFLIRSNDHRQVYIAVDQILKLIIEKKSFFFLYFANTRHRGLDNFSSSIHMMTAGKCHLSNYFHSVFIEKLSKIHDIKRLTVPWLKIVEIVKFSQFFYNISSDFKFEE